MLEVTTNNLARPIFVYPNDKFKSRAALLKEIQKSIDAETKRLVRAQTRQHNLEVDLNARN